LGTSALRSQESLKTAIQTANLEDKSQSSLLQSPQSTPKKSVALAVAYSLILPGLGDFYAGNYSTGGYFMGAEGGLWLTYAGFRVYGDWLKQDARGFAVQKAGADFNGKDDQFAVNLTNFDNVFDYNAAKLRNRQFDLVYDPNSSFNWTWTSAQDRERYKYLRNRGEDVLHNSQFVIGVLFINRIIAAISAVRSTSNYNHQAQVTDAWRLTSRITGESLATQGIELTLSRDF